MRTWLVGLGLLLSGTGLICAQTSVTLTVHVTDAAGSPVQGAAATASPTELWGPVVMQTPVTLNTDRSGEARFTLWLGIYRISAEKQGFGYAATPNLEVSRESQQLPLVLVIATTRLISTDTPCYGDCVTSDPAWLKLIEAQPLGALIELKSSIAPLALQARSATKGMLRKRKPQHS
jgi:hypothetical protein